MSLPLVVATAAKDADAWQRATVMGDQRAQLKFVYSSASRHTSGLVEADFHVRTLF